MDEFLEANQKLWDQWTLEHEESPFYDLKGFKSGKDRLRSIELSELGDVSGKSLLHLQCHFGMDTLAWARRGATVTGIDLSKKSIALARSLSRELKLPAQFHCSDIYQLTQSLSGDFDIVFTSYGVLHWLRDLKQWGEIIAHFLKPNGIFYIVEDHPSFRMFTTEADTKIQLANPYFFSEIPERVKMTGSYATDNQGDLASFYIWNHSIGEVINAIIDAGLVIEFLHEFPYAARAKFPFMEKGADGWWRLPEEYVQIPFLFSLRARKPEIE
ncbi:MAG: class I SAM-dependent methyltransferase [Anaerolineales bacterium]|jgi:SAM-dependent methyltransferase